MGSTAADTLRDAGRSPFRPLWVWLGLLLAANALLVAALTLWTAAPVPLRAACGILAAGAVLAAAGLALRIAGQVREEVECKERYAAHMREAEALTRTILDKAGDGIITYEAGGLIRSFNRAATRILGYSADEALGSKVWNVISGTTSEGARLDTEQVAHLGEASEVEGYCKDGRKLTLEVALSKVRTARGLVYTMVLRDLTERKRAVEEVQRSRSELAQRVRERTAELEQLNARLEAKNTRLEEANRLLVGEIRDRKRAQEELRASEERYQTLVQLSPDAILIHRHDHIAFGNPAAARLFDMPAERLGGLTLSDLIPPDSQGTVREFLRAVLEARKPVMPVEICVLRADGLTLHVEATAAAFREGDATPIQIVLRDITARRRAETELREAGRRHRALARQLLNAQEGERRHLAHELHDELGQTLTAIKITLQAARRVADDAVSPHLDECISLAEKTLGQVRHLSVDLRPAALDRLGLVPSVRGLLEREAQRNGLVTHLEADVATPRLPPDVETACFRIVQEALTNVVRHARAHEVWVGLQETAQELRLSVRDDGIGFNVEAAQDRAARGESLGLLGLHERVQVVGGRVEIASAPGEGTTIAVRVPLAGTEDVSRPGVRDDGTDSRLASG